MLQGQFAKRVGDKMFDKDTAKIVRKHALGASLLRLIPVIGTLIFVFILWHMYNALCERANQKLSIKHIVVAIIVNILIAIALELVYWCIPVLGWLGASFTTYLQFYFSGKSFIETIRKV
ncbi:MAG: hypothetical protein K2I99_03580 [Bacteroidaceae bacterium]|nr:hypothetical protein [Bacteroidaceae bacterium]MDE6722396.1 hypothetical protein [Bacteroidaceae bacterium]